jgi:PAS domain S-box-containing protein
VNEPVDNVILGEMLATLPEVVLLVNRNGVIEYINRVEPGYDPSQVLGMQAEAVLPPDSKVVFAAALKSVLATGEPAEYEVQTDAPDGTSGWYRSRMTLFRDGLVMIVATNITELKAAQDAVSQLRQLLPICAWCDRIQNDEGSWGTIEAYLGDELNTQITHGMCPDCHRRQMEHIDNGPGRSSDSVA